MKENNYAIIMAGGIGSRFWPMSKSSSPKQFHDILGLGKSLIQMTFDRLSKVCPHDQIIIVTNKDYKNTVQEQLPQIREENILLEPCMRNTAPCIAFANFMIGKTVDEANIIVAPSDHLITNEDEFVTTIQLAFQEAASSDSLITLGIKPSRPDTGYGYIEFENGNETAIRSLKRVMNFKEKPQLDIAKEYLEKGNFYWNSGIFIWSLSSINKSFDDYLPQVKTLFDDYDGEDITEFINDIYPKCENISIDYGIMEKSKNVKVILSDFGWSDLGTWGSLYDKIEQDNEKNAIVGKDVLVFNSRENMIMKSSEKLLVLQGIKDCIVVETNEAILICRKEDEQEIKTIVNNLKAIGKESYT